MSKLFKFIKALFVKPQPKPKYTPGECADQLHAGDIAIRSFTANQIYSKDKNDV